MKTTLGDFVEPAFGAINDVTGFTDDQETEMAAAVVELAHEVASYTGEPVHAAHAASAADAGVKIDWRSLLKTILPILLQLL
jgi:hypothetical protein